MNQKDLFVADARISAAIRRTAAVMLEVLPENTARKQAIFHLRQAQSCALMADSQLNLPCISPETQAALEESRA